MQSTKSANQRVTVRLLGATSLGAALVMSGSCAAQMDAVATPTPPPVSADALSTPPLIPQWPMALTPPPPGADPRPITDASPVTTTQGTVARFLTNPDGDVDGFLTSDGRLVRFPPHMSTQLTATVRQGDSAELSGWRDEGGNFMAQRITDTRSGQQLIDQPPMPGARPLPRELRGAGLSRLSAQGQVAHVTTAPRGEPDGVILSDGTVIKLTPPVAQQFGNLVRTGATVSARGYGTRNQYGTALQATSFGSPGNLTQIYDRLPTAP